MDRQVRYDGPLDEADIQAQKWAQTIFGGPPMPKAVPRTREEIHALDLLHASSSSQEEPDDEDEYDDDDEEGDEDMAEDEKQKEKENGDEDRDKDEDRKDVQNPKPENQGGAASQSNRGKGNAQGSWKLPVAEPLDRFRSTSEPAEIERPTPASQCGGDAMRDVETAT